MSYNEPNFYKLVWCSNGEVAQQVRDLWEENHPLFAQWVEMHPFKVLFLTVSTLFSADISVENPNSSQVLGTLRNPWWNLIENHHTVISLLRFNRKVKQLSKFRLTVDFHNWKKKKKHVLPFQKQNLGSNNYEVIIFQIYFNASIYLHTVNICL